jgi:hypothetical protein
MRCAPPGRSGDPVEGAAVGRRARLDPARERVELRGALVPHRRGVGFSTSPFVAQGAQSIAWVKPQRADTVPLAASASETAVELPADLRNQNLLVEVRGQGLVRRVPAFASALAVQTVESYGQLQVTHATTKQPLPKVYVKVYARGAGGTVRFYKDGYTDLRGRFDYARCPARRPPSSASRCWCSARPTAPWSARSRRQGGRDHAEHAGHEEARPTPRARPTD